MADTVKKSRIVSEENYSNFDVLTEDADSLQDIINSEFNERLKNCMTPNLTVLNEPPDLQLTNLETNGFASKLIDATQQFIENEIATELKNISPEAAPFEIENKELPSPETEVIDDLTPPFENITITDVDNENQTAKERFLSTVEPDLDLLSDSQKQATVKDRMFLSTDSACLLFTQTVVVQSPMLTPTLTPTDENYDFLQALKLKSPDTPQNLKDGEAQPEETENNEILSSPEADADDDADDAQNVDSSNSEAELTSDSQQIDEIKRDIHEFVNENLIEVTPPENFQIVTEEIRRELREEGVEEGAKMAPKISEISRVFTEAAPDAITAGNGENVARQEYPENFEAIQKTKEIFERANSDDVVSSGDDECECDSTTVTSESTFVETRTESSNTAAEKGLKKKKSKKAKKDNEKENISVKSSFSKFDALSKKTVLHVRSSDAGKAQEKFNGTNQIDTSSCKSCQKQVFQMEQIKAEKAIWHKNCFRCKECNKQLNVDTYQSNEGVLYCKPHFKALFTPKAVEDEPQPIRPRKHEMIIRENQPEELPPDVVRASDKPDLGLEELQNLNVKERFQVFENHESLDNSLERTSSTVNVKRSPSILSKLAKFQQKGMDIGVADDSLNGVPLEESSSEPEEDDDEIDGTEDPNLIRARRAAAQREIPLHFNNMSEVMSKWESGNQMTREERREERKQEIQSIRSRLFMGKQGKMKELYQQAVAESESGVNVKKSVPLDTEMCEGAKNLKDKFERGEALTHDEELKLRELEEDKSVFESGISKKSRSIFLELDANASKAPHLAPLSPSKSGTEVRRAREAFMARQASEDTVRATDHVDDVVVKTADISNKFKFFETYKEQEKPRKAFRITPPRDGQVKLPSPDRDVYRDPDIIRSDDLNEDDSLLAKKTHTATKMLNIFRQMEENLQKKDEPQGPKPLKRFTPPPEGESQRNESGSEDDDDEVSESEEECGDDETDQEPKIVDEDLLEAQKAARAKQLRAKFEKWEAHEIQREQNNSSSVNLAQEIGEGDSQIESARSLRARFESMRETTTTEKERQPRIKVNRFV